MKIHRHIRNLALIGFMGTGKSTVGRIVARRLSFEFVDTDRLIEAREGKSIEKIFEEQGEPHFRDLESQVVRDLRELSGLVIATGGGLPARQANLDSLKSHSLIVCLWASVPSILDRVGRQRHRPLLKTPDPEAKIRDLLNLRTPFYRQADVLINSDIRSQSEVCQQVVKQFRLARAKER